jgi:hypothetical protein
MTWICIDKGAPIICNRYLVTVENSFCDASITTIAEYKPRKDEWTYQDNLHDFEGWRIIAWKELDKPFKWSELDGPSQEPSVCW